MDVAEFIRNNGTKIIKNPNYNPRSRNNTEPETLIVPDTSPGKDYILSTAIKNALNTYSIEPEVVEKYKEYGIDWNPRDYYSGVLDAILADSQSNWNKAWHALTRTLVNEIGLGTVRGVSDLIDFTIGGAIRTITGEENDYTNPVSETIQEWQKAFEEYQPIYVTPGVDISNGGLTDFGWWMSNMPSIASSLTLLIPSTAATKVVSSLGKAVGINKAIGNTRRFFTAIDKVDDASRLGKEVGTLGKVSQWINNENTVRTANNMFMYGLNGFTSRVMENYQEASQVYQDLLPEILNGDKASGIQGINDMSQQEYNAFVERNAEVLEGVDTNNRTEVAKRIAKAGADRTFNLDMINGFFDAYEIYGLRNMKRFMNAPLRASIRRAHRNSVRYAKDIAKGAKLEDLLKNRSRLRKTVDWLDDRFYGSRVAIQAQLAEGIEEGWNYISQQEGMHYGHVLLGSEPESLFDTRLRDYFQNPELYESAFWGVAGGVVFQEGGSRLARAKQAYNVKFNEKRYAKDNDTSESIPKVSWSQAFEDSEITARKNNIEDRYIKNQTLQKQLEQITEHNLNPFEKDENGDNKILKTKEDKEIAIRRAFRERATNLLRNAMFVGNWDITRAYLESDEVRDALVEAGVVTAEQAKQQQEEVIQLANDMEELFSQNIRAVGNAIRGKDKTTGLNYSDIPTEYFQIIAAENMNHQLAAREYDRAIATYTPTIDSEEKRLETELKEHGINYKEAIRSYIIAQQLGQIDAELDAAKKTIAEGRTKDNIDARTISGQNAIRELELRKKALINLIKTTTPIVGTNEEDNKRADRIKTIANILVTHRAAAATESDGAGGYKMNRNSERYKKLDEVIVNAYNSEDATWEDSVSALKELGIDISGNKEDFAEAAHLADTFEQNISTALGKDGAIEQLDKVSSDLLSAYAKVNMNEIYREIELQHVAIDKDSIRTLAHLKHNEINTLRKLAVEQAFTTIKAIAKKYQESFVNSEHALAFGTLDKHAREYLKNTLSAEDMQIYDDCMKIIGVFNNLVSGIKTKNNNMAAINSLLPELIQNALYQSRRDEYEDVEDDYLEKWRASQKEEIKTEEEDKSKKEQKTKAETKSTEEVVKKTTEEVSTATNKEKEKNTSTSQNPSQATQKPKVDNTPQTKSKARISEIKEGKIDFHITKSGRRVKNPVASIAIKDSGAPDKLNRFGSGHDDYTDTFLKPVEGQEDTYELDFASDLENEGKEEDASVFSNPYFFTVNVPFVNGGTIIKNPVVVIDDDGTIIDYKPGIIDDPLSPRVVSEAEDNDSQSLSSTGVVEQNLQKDNESDDSENNVEEFDEYNSNEQEQKELDNTYDNSNLKGDLTRGLMAYAIKQHNAGQEYNEEEIHNELKEEFKNKVTEEEFEEAFAAVKNKGINSAKRLKESNKEFINIGNFIDASAILDSDINNDTRGKAQKELDKAFNAILDNYIKRAVVDTHDGKKVISLENLLRYANDVANDRSFGAILYDKFVELLEDNDKYYIVERINVKNKNKRKASIVENATVSSEERIEQISDANGRTIDLTSILRDIKDPDEREQIYDMLDNLKPDDEIDYEVSDLQNSNRKKITFKKNGKVIGTATTPKVGSDQYTMINQGWIVDIPKSNDGSTSKLENFFIRLMVNPNNETNIEQVLAIAEELRYTPSKIADKETGEKVNNPRRKELYDKLIEAIKNIENINQYTDLRYYKEADVINYDKANAALANFFMSIYDGVKQASDQWLGRYGISREEYNTQIKERRIQSIHNFFEKRKSSFVAVLEIASNKSSKIKVDTVNQGGLVINSKEEEPIPIDYINKETGERAIGTNHINDIQIAAVDITGDGTILTTGGEEIDLPVMGAANTFVVFPRSMGIPSLAHAFPRSIGEEFSNPEVKEIKDEINKEFTRLLTEWGNNREQSTKAIANFILTLCDAQRRRGIATNNSLLRGFKITPLTNGFDGVQIEYTTNGRKHYIHLFDKHKDGSLTSAIRFDNEKSLLFDEGKHKANQKQVLDRFKTIVNEALKFNLDFDYIKGTKQLIGYAKRKDDGSFVVEIPGGKTHTFESYRDFVIKGGVISVTTKSENGKTNFYRPGTSNSQFDKPRLTFKIVKETTSPVKERKAEITSTTQLKGDLVKNIIQQHKDGTNLVETIINNVLNDTQLNILKDSKLFKELLFGNIIFVPNLRGNIAGHSRSRQTIDGVNVKKGDILVSQLWIDLLNDSDVSKHEEAVRHLIHETIHAKLNTLSKQERTKLFDSLRSIFNDFVKDNEEKNIGIDIRRFEYNTNSENKRKYYKNGEITEKGLEEFLVESITRPALINRLNSISADGQTINKRTVGNTKDKNLFRKLLSVICKIFNLNINKGSLLEKEYKLFKELGILSQTTKTENKTETKVEVETKVETENKNETVNQQLELNFDESEENVVKSEEESNQNVADTIEGITMETANNMTLYEDDEDDSAFLDEQINATYTPEMISIKEKAIADGTFMKAPNGKPTNLTERQWLQVRTNNFINWFGDWLHFNKTNPYSTNIHLGEWEDDFSSADASGLTKVLPIYLDNEWIGEFSFDNNIDDLSPYFNMPSVGGNNVSIEDEYRGKGYGKAAYFEVAKLAASNGKILRSAPDNSRTPASTRVWKSLERDGYAKKIGDRYEFINSSLNNASKVVDENGEPLVVYHGGSSTKIFDTSGKRNEGAGIKKGIKGSYFTTSRIDAERYEAIYSVNIEEKYSAIRDAVKEGEIPEEEIPFIDRQWEVDKPSVREFFLNIKTAIETVYTGNDVDGYEEHSTTPENYDGQHIVIEGRPYEEYVAIQPTQIKSATYNNGNFSEDDDIDFSSILDTQVASLGQVRDTIIPENRETFESLVSKGAIQINC